MFGKTQIRLALILSILVAVFLLNLAVRTIHHVQNSDKATPNASSDMAAAKLYGEEMSIQEYRRWKQIDTSVRQGRNISDADLDWLLQTLNTPAPNAEPVYAEGRRLDMLTVLQKGSHYSPSQIDKIYNSTAKLLSSSSSSDKLGTLAVMRASKDKRAIPDISLLLNDPDPAVKRQAQKTLNMLSSSQT